MNSNEIGILITKILETGLCLLGFMKVPTLKKERATLVKLSNLNTHATPYTHVVFI